MLNLSKNRLIPGFLAIMTSMSLDAAVPLSRVLEQSVTPYSEKRAYGPSQYQYALRWHPKPSEHLGATVVFVHGGCWLSEYDHTHADSFVSDLAERGFDTWTLEYRRTGSSGGGWPTSLNDVLDGLTMISDFYSRSATEAGKNPPETATFDYSANKVTAPPIIVVGHSAGGHLALLAAFSKGPDQSVHTIGLAPITNLIAYAEGLNSCQKGTVPFMGGTPSDLPEEYDKATLSNKSFSGLQSSILQGEADPIVTPDQSLLAGASTTLVPEAGHFDWLSIGSRAHTVLIDTLAAILEDASNATHGNKADD